MQATITYMLSETAQRAAMVATGQPVERKQTVTVEVPIEDLDLMQVAENGTLYLDLISSSAYTQRKWMGKSTDDYHALVDAGCDIIAALRAGRDKEKADLAAVASREKAERAARYHRLPPIHRAMLEWTHDADTCPARGGKCTLDKSCVEFPTDTDRINMARAAYDAYSQSDGTELSDFVKDVLLLNNWITGKVGDR